MVTQVPPLRTLLEQALTFLQFEWSQLEMFQSIGIGKYWLKFLVSVSVFFNRYHVILIISLNIEYLMKTVYYLLNLPYLLPNT